MTNKALSTSVSVCDMIIAYILILVVSGRVDSPSISQQSLLSPFSHMNRDMANPAIWLVRPAKTQISLGIRQIWSECSLSAWRKLRSLATHWAHSEGSDQTGWIPRLIWVFTGRTLILLVLSCHGSYGLVLTFRSPRMMSSVLSVCKEIKYLGVVFTKNKSFCKAKKHNYDQARKATHLLYKRIRNLNLPIDLQLQLFETYYFTNCTLWIWDLGIWKYQYYWKTSKWIS